MAALFAGSALAILTVISLAQQEPKTANLPQRKHAARSESKRHPEPVNLAGPFFLERSEDTFGVRSHGVIEKTPSGSKFYPLPQSTVEMYKKLRGADLKYMLPRTLDAKDYERQEVIGPYQVEDDRVWFGKQFYDGEGDRGVGSFGYFDMNTRKYVLFTPPQIAPWETSALLVEPNTIWLALDHFGEDISTWPGGLLQWDRSTQHVRRYPLEFVVTNIRRDVNNRSSLLLTTFNGYARLLSNGELQRFRVTKLSNGQESVTPIRRFPPPPSHY